MSESFDARAWLKAQEQNTQPVTPTSAASPFDAKDWLNAQQSRTQNASELGRQQAADFTAQLAKYPTASPVQQYQAFEKYGQQFQDHLAQQGYSGEQITNALASFGQQADPRNQSSGWDTAADLGNSFVKGTGRLMVDALSAVPESTPLIGGLAEYLQKEGEGKLRTIEKEYSAAKQINDYLGNLEEQKSLENGANEVSALLANLKTNPMQLPHLLVEQVPQVLLGVATGSIGLGAVNAAGGAGRARNDIEQAYEDTYKNNPQQLLQLPEIQERMAKGMSFADAVNDAKIDVTDHWKSLAAAAVIGASEALTPTGKLGQGVNRGVFKTLGKEAGQEFLQEGAEQLNSNLAVGQIDGKTQATDNVLRNATLGAIAGLGMGVPAATEAYFNGRNAPQSEQAEAPAVNPESPKQADQEQTQQTATPINSQALDEALKPYQDSEEYAEMRADLERDIEDGVIEERAKSNSQYGKLAQAYLNATGQATAEPQAESNTQEQTEIDDGADPEMERVLNLRERMTAWRNGKKLGKIGDLLPAMMTFKNEDAKRDFVMQQAFGEVQSIAKKHGVDPADGNAMRKWLDDYVAKRKEAQTKAKQTREESYRAYDDFLSNEPLAAEPQAVENPQNVANQAEAELQQTANTAPTAPRNVLTGSQDSVDVGENDYQPFQYEVMEADDLAPTQQKAGNQLRDRERTASQAQVNKIARNLDPRKVADSPTMDLGAPLLAQDGKTVIAGNGRSMAIRQAYAEGNADNYRQYLQQNAAKFGVDGEQLAAMKNPVLVRRLNAAVDIKQTAINSNEQGGMRMSNLEQAKVDAQRLPNMAGFELDESGNLNTPNNRSFISQFIQNQPENLRNELLDKEGKLSQTGVQRLRNAMLFQAYGDTDTLARAVESTDQGARNIINALTRIAPKVAQVKQDIANGDVNDVDISSDIVQAVEKYNQLKNQNQDVGEYLQQQDFVSELSPEAKSVLRIFDENSRSSKRISDILTSYYQAAETQGNAAQTSMFGEEEFDKTGTLEQAKNAELEERYSRSPIKSVEANIKRGREAMNTAIAERRTVHRAMFNHNLDGWVDFEWGDVGTVKANGKTKGGMGISHILEARLRKDGMSYEQATQMLVSDVVDVIARGHTVFEKTVGNSQNIRMEHNGYQVTLTKNKGNNAWIVTAFELFEGANRKGYDKSIPTDTNPTLSRAGTGASNAASDSEQFARNNHSQLNDTHAHSQRGRGVVAENGLNLNNSQQNVNLEESHARELLRRALGEHADKIELVRDEQFGKNDARRGAEGWYRNGKLYLNLDGITDGNILSKDERLVWVAWHELGHHGVEVQLSHALRNQLYQARKNVVVNGIAKRIFAERQAEAKRENNPNLAISQDVATEEAIVELFAAMETGNWAEIESRYRVHIVQEWRQPQSDLVKRLSHVANFFKRLVARITGKNLDTVSNQEVLNLLATVKQGIAKSAENPTASEARYSFAGENARNADHTSLEKAKADVSKGKDAESVRQETGWFKGVDGKWRFELDSSQAKLNSDVFEPTEKPGERRFIGLLGDVLNYLQLFKAYPDLAQTPVSLRLDRRLETADTNGRITILSYSPLIEEIKVNANSVIGPRGLKSILLHEIQHAIQRRENFARGGNPESFTVTTEGEYAKKHLTELLRNTNSITRDLYHAYVDANTKAMNAASNNESESVQAQARKERDQAEEALLAQPDGSLIQSAYLFAWEDDKPILPYDQYHRLAGETESRNVQSRMEMTAEERRNTSPKSTEDVPYYKQAVRFDNDRADFALREESDSDFAKAVDVVTNKLNALKAGEQVNGYPNQPITLGTTPDVLKMLGYADVDVQIGWGTVEKIMRQHFDLPRGKHSNIHNLSPDVVKQIPQQLNNPVAIYESGTKDGALVVLTELSSVEKATGKESPVVVALHFAENNGHLDVINIASAYERNANKVAYDDLNKRKVLYVNKAKGQKLIRTYPNLQLVSAFSDGFDLSGTDIKTETDLSQYQSENSDVRYSRKAPKQDAQYQRDLMVTHNISAKGIMHAKKMGGLPFASVAVAKQSNPLTGFGEVTLIGDRDYIDPKGANKAEVYGTDIHSKRYEHDNEGTLDEVIAEMKAHYRRNSNNYDSSSLRSSVQKSTPQFESITDIQNNKSRLVSQEDYDAAFNALNNQAVDLARTLRMSYLDVLNNISALAHPDVEMAAELIEDVFPNADTLEKQNAVKNMLESLHNMPSTYFEGKAKEVTQFSDFSGAVIPNDLPKNAYDVLQQAGLKIYEYDPDVATSRAEIIKQATNELDEQSGGNILFSRAQARPKSEGLEKLRQSKTIRISGTEIESSEDIRQYRRNAMEYGKTLRGTYVNKDTGREISLGRAGVTEVLHHDISNPEHLQSVAAIPEIIENSIYIDTLPNEDSTKNPDIKEYEYYVAGLNIGGTDYTVKAAVGIATTGDKYYDHKLTQIEKGDLLEMTSRLSSAEISNQSPLSDFNDKRLLQILQDKQGENSSTNFKRWFGNSKVVDENGDPLVVYHGSNANFTVFDKSKIDVDNLGTGFYFSSEEIANSYANRRTKERGGKENTYAVYLKMENPLDFRNVTREQAIEANKQDFLSFGFNETEAQQQAEELVDSFVADTERFNEKADFAMALPDNKSEGMQRFIENEGIDGFIVPGKDKASGKNGVAYVVFEPNQIKSATDNNGDFSSENDDIRFSRKQTSMEILTDGKVKHETLWGTVKAGEFGKIWNEVQRKTDFALTDETRPVLDWIGDLDLAQVQANELKSDFELADGVRHSLNSQLMQRFLKPLHKNIVNLAKKRKKDIEWTKKALGIWTSANYSIKKNQELLARDEQAMRDAKQAFDEAKANGTAAEIDKAERAYIRAERQYRYRKHDVELNNWEVDEKGKFIVPRKVGVAGFSIPHAKALMAEVEKHFSQKEVQDATEPLREAVEWNIRKNFEHNRITEEQFKEYMRNLDYVPLTGDPDSLLKDDDDFIGGASSKGVNTSRDKNMKGRVNSEAEDAIDAVYRMLDKTVANAAWQPFKNGIDTVYEQKLAEAKAQGMTEEQAKEHVADTVGIRRQVMQGTTRTNDEVLIRKFGNVYYEYRLPEEVIKAIKGGQRDVDEFKVWQHKLSPMRYVRKLTSLYAQGVTQFKLPFAPKNMIRDIWEKSALITTRDIYDANGKPLSQKVKSRIGSRTFAALANPAEMARVLRATGRLAKGDTENLDVNNEYQRDLKELIELGGVSNYSTYLARTDKDLVEEIKKLDKPHHRAVEGALHLVAVWNGTFDYASSLAAYRALKEAGVDKKQAADITLNLTNFRKQGWAAKHFRPLYMFLNPTLQGGKNLVQMMKTRRGQVYLASRVVMAMAVWSLLMSLDDEDDQGGKRMLANGDLSREILIPTGEKDKYIRIPVGYGAPQMANNIATNLVQLMNNQISVGDAVANIITHNVKSVLPIAPSEISASKDPLAKLADTLTPSLFKSQMQWLMDRNAFGASIKPNSVQREKLLSQQSRQNTAEFWKETAEMMYEQFGVDMHPELYKHIFDSYRGMMGSLGDYVSASIENPNRALQGKSEVVPILNDYYGVKGENRIASLFYEYKGEAEKLAAEYKYYEEKGRLAEWKTPEKMQIVNWNNKVNDEMKKVTQARSKLKKDEGKMSEEMKASRLQNINTINDRIQREAVYAWRKREGLATANPR